MAAPDGRAAERPTADRPLADVEAGADAKPTLDAAAATKPAAAADAPPTTPGHPPTKPKPPVRQRRPTIPRITLPPNPVARHLYEHRPNIVSQKTRKPEWRQLHSRWRWMHAFFFWAGPPAFLLWRVWPVLLFDMILAAIVAADHVLRALAARGDGVRDSLLPNITDHVIESLSPMVRFMLFAASMLLTLRLGRVYERWWQVRQAFSAVGSTATSLSQRASAWCGGGGDDNDARRRGRLAADLRRWAVIWHYSILHVCENAPAIHPRGAALMTPEELAIYGPARKGRQIAVDKLVQLISDLDLEEKKFNALEQLLQRGVAAAGVCTGVRFQALPYSLTLISTGFVELFLVTLVLMMVQRNGPDNTPDNVSDTIFTVCVVLGLYFGISLLFLGADEVANQLEDPFPWLPLLDIVATTERDVMRVPGELGALREAEAAAARRREEEGEAGGAKRRPVDVN